jgi:leader peptidase (prepilin peptidase)/N-methyltransferase
MLCHMTRSWPAIVGLGAIFAAPLVIAAGSQTGFYLCLALIPPLVWISIVDLTRREIPDLATALVATVGLVRQLVLPDGAPVAAALLAAAVVLAFGILGSLYWRRHGREALGLGDVKLLAAGALVVGADRFWIMLLLASVGGIAAALISTAGRKEGIPFGPFIAYSILVTLTLS